MPSIAQSAYRVMVVWLWIMNKTRCRRKRCFDNLRTTWAFIKINWESPWKVSVMITAVYYMNGDLEDERCAVRTVPLHVRESCRSITTSSFISPLMYLRSLSANSLDASCSRSSPPSSVPFHYSLLSSTLILPCANPRRLPSNYRSFIPISSGYKFFKYGINR
jgi:hypothetical protein